MRGRILMKLDTVTYHQEHMTSMTFQGHCLKGQGHRKVYCRRHIDRWFIIDFLSAIICAGQLMCGL